MSSGLQRTSEVGGALPYSVTSVTATGIVVSAVPQKIFSIHAHNLNAAIRYLKVYDKATAATEEDTPKLRIPMPTGSGPPLTFPKGVMFLNGISIRAVTELADNGTTGATASETIVNMSIFPK